MREIIRLRQFNPKLRFGRNLSTKSAGPTSLATNVRVSFAYYVLIYPYAHDRNTSGQFYQDKTPLLNSHFSNA